MNRWFGIALAAVAFGLAGCETESSDNISISISPNNATMEKGESREFTASGWRDYTWALTDTSIGVLSTTKGNSTVYTALSGGTTNAALSQILVVTVNIGTDGTSGTSTNIVQDTGLVTAQSLITQTLPPAPAPEPDPAPVAP